MDISLEHLASACRTDLTGEKRLLAPSLRVGHQWVDAAVRAGVPAVNLRVTTLRGLALELAGPALAAAGLTPIYGRGGVLLMDRLWARLSPGTSGYLSKLPETAGLARALHRTVMDLRLAGLDAPGLGPAAFEVADKGRDLARVLSAWTRELKARKLADQADVLGLARARLEKAPGLLAGKRLLVPACLVPSRLEREMLEAAPPDRVVRLAPPAGPGPGGESVSFFRAVGEVNEVREALRRVLAEGVPLDEVELLHTDAAAYVPLIYETLLAFYPGEGFGPEELPVTFAEGVPVRYSRPGRALLAWLAWIEGDFRQAAAASMVQDGLLDIEGAGGEGPGFASLAGLLRLAGIGFGRDRWRPKLDELKRRLEKDLTAPAADEDGEEAGGRRNLAARRLEGLKVLGAAMEKLLDNVPPEQAGAAAWLDAAGRFLDGQARTAGRFDNFAAERLRREMMDYGRWLKALPPGKGGGDAAGDARAFLADLAGRVCVLGSGPRPGRLHVANVESGGHTGRRRAFILGLDDRRFPGPSSPDPLLLDAERGRLSPDLDTAAAKLRRKAEDFRRLAGRLSAPGELILSFSCRDVLEDRETFPAALLLEVFRRAAGRPDAGLKDFEGEAPLASFAPASPDRALGETEWWMAKLLGEDLPEAGESVTRRYPHLGRGLEARRRRESPAFTGYDGLVPEAAWPGGIAGSAGPVFSPSRLEKLASCPRAYFFKYLLGIEPPEKLEPEPGEWLDAMEFGKLAHEVLHDFMSGLAKEGLTPSAARDRGRMKEVVDRLAAKYRDRRPPATEAAFRSQVARLEKAAGIFLVEEEIFYRGARPLHLEASIGMPQPPGEPATPFDDEEPVALRLPGGGEIRVRGRIDRIDESADAGGGLILTDYKSGSAFKYRQGRPFREGRVIQHALYLAMADERLRRMGREGRARLFRYFFPDERERGEEISYPPSELAEAGQVLEKLCRLAAAGAFPASDSMEDDCGFCDYAAVCGNAGEDPFTAVKLADAANDVLAPFRELRGRKARGEDEEG